MDVITPDRLMTLAGFMALLLLVWLVVKLKSGATLQHTPADDARLDIAQSRMLGDGNRAILMQVAGRDVLVLTHRKAGARAILLPTPTTPTTHNGAAQVTQ